MLTRRDCLGLTAQASAALAFKPRWLAAQDGTVMKRAIPSTGEELPIIGLGSSATFSRAARADERAAIRDVFTTLLDNGGTVFDTAPGYGVSEEVAASVVNELGIAQRLFWATKLNVAGFRGGAANPTAAWAQIETSISRYGREPIDLMQVHNLADMPTQFGILRELKEQGRVRYIGTTSTSERRYDELAAFMRNEPLDFVGLDYAVDNTSAEETLLPLAQERGIAVLVYLPFGRTRLWSRVEGRDVPAWAVEFGAHSWAQFFLKFAASHPAVTVATPATSKPHHMLDNMGAALGRLPDRSERQRMIDYVETLPQA